MKLLYPIITIDGPSGVGKSSLCLAISKKIKWQLLQSGIIYRILTYKILKKNIFISECNVCKFIKYSSLFNSFTLLQIEIKKYNFNKNHSELFLKNLSIISKFPKVRRLLLNVQYMFCQPPGLIAEGRDMGTLIFSNAILKFFIDANLEIRALRRTLELQKKGFNVNFKDILLNIWERDNKDYNNIISPLIPAKNSIIIDSTYLNFKQTFNIIMKYITKNSIIYTIIKKNSL